MDTFTYLLPLAINQKIIQKYSSDNSKYRIAVERSEKFAAILLDTFDFEMYQSAKMLFQVGEKLLLFDLPVGRLIEQVSPEGWSFTKDLPEGPLSSLLKGVSSLRAFLPVAKVFLSFENGLLLDDEEKTRARFHNLIIHNGRKKVGVVSTECLRGYDKAHSDLLLFFKKIGAVACRDVGQVYETLGIKGEKFAIKKTFVLNPDAPVRESACIIIKAFLEVARRNENGVVADYDTEFLHDYRVSLRKVRSVLSLFKGVFGAEETIQLKNDFATLMQKTNTLRDLDVYLLNKKQYFKMVPEDTHEGLEILFDYFAAERTKELLFVSKTIQSKSYHKEIGRLEKYFSDNSILAAGPRGEENSLAFSCRLILKRYGKVCKIARNIDEKTEDDVVHQLRINCKKLRYLMEFFGPLFADDEMKMLIKSLKILQNNLGNFNDYSVQQAFLRHVLLEKISEFAGLELKVAESVGALTAMLARLQKEERQQVMKNFNLFDSPETRATFAKLFRAKAGAIDNDNILQG